MSISIMIFTRNEELHLQRCLENLRWCDDVIVVDSFSTDRSEEMCRAKGVRFVQHAFSSMWEQRNWAMEHIELKHDWVLILDADELVPNALVEEMHRAVQIARYEVGAFRVRRRFHMWGRWLKHSSLYPTWLVRLCRKGSVRFYSEGHGEGQSVNGSTMALKNDLVDENLKGLDEWFDRQNRYSRKDAEYEIALDTVSGETVRGLASIDPMRRRRAMKALGSNIPGRALWYFLYTYVVRAGFLDGKDGLMFCILRAVYQEMVVVKKYDRLRTKAIEQGR